VPARVAVAVMRQDPTVRSSASAPVSDTEPSYRPAAVPAVGIAKDSSTSVSDTASPRVRSPSGWLVTPVPTYWVTMATTWS